MSRINSKFIVIAISVLLLLYFVIFPMGILLYDSIMLDGAINLENYRNVYSQDVNWRALTNTIELSLGVMIVSVLITFPLAWLVGRTDMPGKNLPYSAGIQLHDSAVCRRYCLGTAAEPQCRLSE